MATLQDTFNNADNLAEQLGSEVVGGELRPLNHDDGVTLSFNGSTQYGVATGYKGVTGTSAKTVMLWFKTITTSSNSHIIWFGGGTFFTQYAITIETGGILYCRMGGEAFSFASAMNDGQWHHVAITNPSSSTLSGFKAYLDGNPITWTTVVTSGGTLSVGTQNDVTVGARNNVDESPQQRNYFAGSVDDVRLYNTVLTADQIYSLVHAGIEPPTTNLQAQWLFNESGSFAIDSSSNGRNIALVNSPTWVTDGKPFYANRTRSTSTELVADVAAITDFDFTVAKRSAGTLGRFQFSDDGSTWVNANGNSSTGYGAYDFDGVNDVINCGSDASIDDIFSGGGTVMFWFYARSKGEGDAGRIFSKGPNGSNSNSTQLLFEPFGYFSLVRSFSVNRGYWFMTSLPVFNQWNHCAITYNESSTSNDPIFYLNGVVQSDITEFDTPLGTATTDASNDFKIGSRGTDRYWDGYITDLRVYKGDILSSTTIRDYYLDAIEPSETLDAHWKFNGNALDETDNNNDGSVSGAINTTDWHKLPAIGNYDLSESSVLDFDGNNDQVTISDNNVFSFGNGSTDSPFSISAWVYMHDATAFNIMMKDNNSTAREYRLKTDNSDILYLVLVDQSAGQSINRFTNSITHLENQWVHIAATYDGSSSNAGIKLYINGNRADVNGGGAGYTAMENTSQLVEIGAWAASSQYSNGLIANVAIWSDVRTQSEIIAECENGWVDVNNANLVAYYPLNGNAIDYLGTYHGSITGPTITTDYKRPATIELTQQSIDISGLGFADFYYRYLTESNKSEFTTSLTEISLIYDQEQLIEIISIAPGDIGEPEINLTLKSTSMSDGDIGDPELSMKIQFSGISSGENFGDLESQNGYFLDIGSVESGETFGSLIFAQYVLSRYIPPQTNLKNRNVKPLKNAALVPSITIKNQNLPVQQFPASRKSPGFKFITGND